MTTPPHMPPKATPEERRLAAQIAANTRWARVADRAAATRPARDALLAKFERDVPADVVGAEARAKAAASLRRAHFQRLALASAKARRRTA